MANFIVIIICLLIGLILKASGRLGPDGSKAVNGLVINIALPAMILCEIRNLEFTTDLWVAVSAPWLLFGLSTLVVIAGAQKFKWNRSVTGTLILTAGLANTSFVGFPLLEVLVGPEALKIGVVADQLGSFLILSTAAVGVLTVYGNPKKLSAPLWKRLVTFPPLASLLLAFLIRAIPSISPQISDATYLALGKVAGTLIPLALISVGLQLSWDKESWRRSAKPVAFGLTLKLIVAPSILTLFYVKLLGQTGLTTQVSILEIAMAPMISGAILAVEGGLDRHLASAMVFVGIPLSLLTVPAWNWILLAL